MVDVLLVSFDSRSKVLLVGRKHEGDYPDIVNAIEGSEAEKLYKKLIKTSSDDK